MSQESVDIVRRSWSAFVEGGLDSLEEFWSEDIEWRAIEGAPDDVGEIRGRLQCAATTKTGSTRSTG